MGTLATMDRQDLDIGAASGSFSALPNLFEATLLAAMLAAQPAEARTPPRDSLFPVHWNQQLSANESFHAVLIGQLTQSEQVAAWLATYTHAAALKELELLPVNWDGQSAERTSPQAIRNAELFLASLEGAADTFEPFADPDGSIGLEGHKDQKSTYIIVSREGAISYVIREGDTVNRGSDVDANTMRRLLDVLF